MNWTYFKEIQLLRIPLFCHPRGLDCSGLIPIHVIKKFEWLLMNSKHYNIEGNNYLEKQHVVAGASSFPNLNTFAQPKHIDQEQMDRSFDREKKEKDPYYNNYLEEWSLFRHRISNCQTDAFRTPPPSKL